MADEKSLTDYQGPWWNEVTVKQVQHLTDAQLAEMRAERKILAIKFNDGNYYYPVRQFAIRPTPRIVHGLKEVLDVLATGIDDPETWSVWLAAPLAFNEETTMWAALHQNRLAEVLVVAKHDSYSWSH
jgi:hypothetical protein